MLTGPLFPVRDVRHVPPAEARLAAALRLWVMLNKADRCPLQAVVDRLGSVRAAAHLHLLLEAVGAAWPEPFCVAPPCCPRLSHDEALALDMVRLAAAGDRPAFDRLLQEMLPADVRDRLYVTAAVLGRTLAA